ncbi:sensor domain-containing protein [Lysobacter humi (ex Lee et al. 2017)]
MSTADATLDPVLAPFAQAVAAAAAPLGCLDAEGLWLRANAPMHALVGDPCPPLYALAGCAPTDPPLAPLLAGERPRLRLALSTRGIALDVVALPGVHGRPAGFLVQPADDTAERALAERDLFFALTPDLLAVLDARDRLVETNPAWEATLGWPAEELDGRALASLLHPDDAERTAAFVRDVRSGVGDAGHRMRLRSRFGGWRWLEWTLRHLDDGRLYGTARDVTDQVRARDAMLRHREELERRIADRTRELDGALARLQLHADNSPLASIEWDARLRVVHWSRRATEMFGWAEDEVARRTLPQWPFLDAADARDVGDAMDRLFRHECSRATHTVRMRTRGGRVRVCEWFDSALFDDSGAVSSILTLVQDVTERQAALGALQDSEERFRLAFEQTAIGMAHVGLDGYWMRVNRRLATLLGPRGAHGALLDALHPDDRAAVGRGLADVLAGRVESVAIEARLHAGGEDTWTLQTLSLRRDADGVPAHYLLAVEDIAARKRAEQALQQAHEALEAKVAERTRELERLMAVLEGQAREDALTGLPNRRGLLERLPRSLDRSARQDGATAVMFVDLDRFKQVNDTLGHDAGDELLRECARRLASSVRKTDIVARLGGDEFVIVLENVRDPRRQARQVAEKVRAALATPVQLGEAAVGISASIGVVVHEPGAGTAAVEELIARADRRMYAAKHRGGDGVHDGA